MQVVFATNDPEGAPLRELAVRRVRFAMRRLAWLVPRVEVQLSDINGPEGGVDKRCQIEMQTDAVGGRVVVTSIARDWRVALEAAVARAARTLVSAWRRHRKSGDARHAGLALTSRS